MAMTMALGLGACAVGPDFKPPAAPAGAGPTYTAAPLPAATASAPGTGGAEQHFAQGQDVPALWWQVFQSPALDALIRQALTRSPSVEAAQAALRQAQALYEADAGSRQWPTVTGQLGATRQRASQAASQVPGGTLYNLYNASVNVSYTVDAFGGTRRALEASQAAVDVQNFQLEAAYLSLTANLVTTAIQEASLRAQLQATQEVIDAQQRSVDVVSRQAQLGAVARSVVLAQQTLLAQTRATMPALQKALAQTRHLLAVYAGGLPNDGAADGTGLPTFTLAELSLPTDLPVSLPSALVRQRPDIRASEAQLHQASAQVGVATANLYPQITLSGSVGEQSLRVGDLFSPGSLAWSLGTSLLQPIFNGGALQARQRAAAAAYDQAAAQYRQTVLNAFLNVANTLQALDSDAQSLQAQAVAEGLARQSLDLVTQQYGVGAVSYLALLDAQRAAQQARIGLVQAQAARYADAAALFQALGGGWWMREAATAATATPAPPAH
jgi:NodT family efflux transporter outer membrane factor (OMF) lipoprotein